MKGILINKPAGWFVMYSLTRDEITSGYESLPLHPDDVKQIQEDSQRFDNIEARIAAYPDVEFEIEEVYNKNDQVGYRYLNYAKLIKEEAICEYSGLPSPTSYTEDYPELEATVALCEDIIEERDSKKIPAPDELQQELRRVRVVKTAHVRAQRYTLAGIYREAEKEIESLILNQINKAI
jgi:hypothetical protein